MLNEQQTRKELFDKQLSTADMNTNHEIHESREKFKEGIVGELLELLEMIG